MTADAFPEGIKEVPVEKDKRTFVVSGVCCSTEESVLRKCLDGGIGPEAYTFSLATAELAVQGSVEERRVLDHVREAGFTARRVDLPAPQESFWERHRQGVIAGISGLLLLVGVAFDQFDSAPIAARAILLASILIGGWGIFSKALKALRARVLDMNVLMTVAVVGAVLIGKWEEGAAVIVLFSLSLMLESYSATRTRRAVRSLLDLSPEMADVIHEGRETTVPAKSVQPGELLMIRPGQRIPLDGIVETGISGVVETMITGESTPVEKVHGAQVYAGSINDRGVLTVRVTRAFEDTTLARIVNLIEEAQQQRAPVQNFMDRFAAIYTPAVLAIALLVALAPPLVLGQPFIVWLYRSLVMLVIACPCALVISTPVTVVSALATAARRGMLIKGGKHLETLAKVRAIAFDKTGTLTEGKPNVTDVIPLNSRSREELLEIVAAIEHRSEHHLATAVLQEATRAGVDYRRQVPEQFKAIPGKGVMAKIGDTTYYLGNQRLCEDRNFCSADVKQRLEQLEREGKTTIVLGKEEEPLCIVAVRDGVRHQSRDAVSELRELGVSHMVMLSGDHATAVEQLAGEVGIEHQLAQMLPEEKMKAIRELRERYGTVAMVGDGINDAPALAAASVGIAMGTNGTDTALETADVVLMRDNLSALPLLLRLSRKTMAVVRQNVAFALAVKLIFLALSVAGVATLWMAVLADDGAALLVILNGLRLLSVKK
jgi:Zn2+/Cd2+-exporting ATPase